MISIRKNHVLNETLVIKSPPVPTRLILGPLRANVTVGGSGPDNPIEAEVIIERKESEEKACHDKLVREEMNRSCTSYTSCTGNPNERIT